MPSGWTITGYSKIYIGLCVKRKEKSIESKVKYFSIYIMVSSKAKDKKLLAKFVLEFQWRISI